MLQFACCMAALLARDTHHRLSSPHTYIYAIIAWLAIGTQELGQECVCELGI